MTPAHFEIRCQNCAAREICGPEGLHRRLFELHMLRRAENPEIDLLVELFRSALPRMTCPTCGQLDLSFAPFDAAAQDEWAAARSCSQCGTTIPPERFELFPDVELCVACQRKEESGKNQGTGGYCPRCGAELLVKAGGQGVTRYMLRCSECSWKTG